MKKFSDWLQLKENNSGSFNFETQDLEDLIQAINRLPDTIDFIAVTDRLCSFSPGQKLFAPNDSRHGYEKIKGDPNWRQKAEEVLRKLQSDKDFDKIDSMGLRGYKGGGATDSFYTYFSCPAYRQFSRDMSAGKYGPLD
jgi:hypothetical protein